MKAFWIIAIGFGMFVGSACVANTQETRSEDPQPRQDQQALQDNEIRQDNDNRVVPHEETVREVTKNNLPGERFVLGRVQSTRSGAIRIDIGHPKLLYVPLKAGQDKGLVFQDGDPIVVTMNEQNAIVDYHHPSDLQAHEVIHGRLITPLTVGLDKAVVQTETGQRAFYVYAHIRGKFAAIPRGAPAVFLADERGQLVDVYIASDEALRESAKYNKQPLKGAHRRQAAQYLGKAEDERIRVKLEGQQSERTLGVRRPLHKLDTLKQGQDVVLLIDDQNYVIEVATPDAPPER